MNSLIYAKQTLHITQRGHTGPSYTMSPGKIQEPGLDFEAHNIMNMHAIHLHVNMYAWAPTCMHTEISAMQTFRNVLWRADAHVCSRVFTHARMHAPTHARTHARTHAQTHICPCALTCTWMQTQTHACTRYWKCKQTGTQTHEHTLTHKTNARKLPDNLHRHGHTHGSS